MSEQLWREVPWAEDSTGLKRWVCAVPVEPCIHGNIDPHEYTEPCGEWHEDTPLGCEVPTIKDCPGSPTLNNDQT